MSDLVLGLRGSANGAIFRASTAGNARIRIDYILAIAFADCLNGAAFSARAASDALITDYICHDSYLHHLMDILYSIRSKKSIAIIGESFRIVRLYKSFALIMCIIQVYPAEKELAKFLIIHYNRIVQD